MSKISRPTPGYPEGYVPEPKEESIENKSAHKDKGTTKTAGERVETLKKNIAARREAPGAEELLEVAELTEEQLEAIRFIPFFQDFEEGMWLYYKENVGDGKSEAELEAEFEEWCREHARENLEYLLKKGELENWKDYVDPHTKTQKEKKDEGEDAGQPTEEENEPTAIKEDESEEAEGDAEKIEAKDWKEIKRQTEVMAIGDLHGSFEGFKENLKSLGVAKENPAGALEWVGGNRKLVFVGDILGDRNVYGKEIISVIGDLQKQAEVQGGEISVLAGNHDDFWISSLADIPSADTPAADSYLDACISGHPLAPEWRGQALDLSGLAEFGDEKLRQLRDNKLKDLNDAEFWQELKTQRPRILENMRGSEKGKKILEGVCSMKLAEIHDDTLFLHTNPTTEIMKYLFQAGDIKKAVNFVNENYQRNLRAVLLEGKEPEKEFAGLRHLFCNTSNREDFIFNLKSGEAEHNEEEEKISQRVNSIRAQGINAIVHGHTDEGKAVRGVERFGFPIISIDTSAFKDKYHTKDRSILKIGKDGKMQRAEKMEFIRQ